MTFDFTGPHGERMSPSAVIRTHLGPVQGLVIDGVHRFLGMRYAAPPIGRRRFKPPADPEPWASTAEAIHYGPPALQGIRGPEVSPRDDFALSLMVAKRVGGHVKTGNEDCLYLNVWTPGTDDAARPVLVWFHGGGFAYGSGVDPLFDGTRLARRGDVVIVTVNHRLNLFGYLNLTGTHEYYEDSVNVGAQDLVHALRWVQRNIASFGGDPGNVTIAGESGGGLKVNDMLAMPSARGLFHKAIVQSGARAEALDADAVREDSLRILRAAGIEEVTPERLSTVLAQDLLDAGLGAFAADGTGSAQFRDARAGLREDLAIRLGTAVDGRILPRHPFGEGAPDLAADIPMMIGWTKDEWNLMLVEREPWFVDMSHDELLAGARAIHGDRAETVVEALRRAFPTYGPGHLSGALVSVPIIEATKRIVDLKAAQPAPVYAYQLDWETPVGGGIFRAAHSLELPLMFDNVEQARSFVGPGPEPQLVADQMSESWLAFMRSGSPAHPGVPAWAPWRPDRRTVMAFDVESRVVEDPFADVAAVLAAP